MAATRIRPPGPVDSGADQLRRRVRATDVPGKRIRRAAPRLDCQPDRIEAAGRPPDEHDPRPGGGECVRDAGPDAAPRSGHQRPASPQVDKGDGHAGIPPAPGPAGQAAGLKDALAAWPRR